MFIKIKVMKKHLYISCVIILICLFSNCYALSDGYFYSGGGKRYFTIDSTSLNLIVADTSDMSLICSNVSNIFNGNSDTVFFCEEDDNIIIKSKNLPYYNISSLIQTITNNHPEKISFYAYSTVTNGNYFWIRNTVVSKLK
jgi:hypothetical protein